MVSGPMVLNGAVQSHDSPPRNSSSCSKELITDLKSVEHTPKLPNGSYPDGRVAEDVYRDGPPLGDQTFCVPPSSTDDLLVGRLVGPVCCEYVPYGLTSPMLVPLGWFGQAAGMPCAG
jgi:hypothetical protein